MPLPGCLDFIAACNIIETMMTTNISTKEEADIIVQRFEEIPKVLLEKIHEAYKFTNYLNPSTNWWHYVKLKLFLRLYEAGDIDFTLLPDDFLALRCLTQADKGLLAGVQSLKWAIPFEESQYEESLSAFEDHLHGVKNFRVSTFPNNSSRCNSTWYPIANHIDTFKHLQKLERVHISYATPFVLDDFAIAQEPNLLLTVLILESSEVDTNLQFVRDYLKNLQRLEIEGTLTPWSNPLRSHSSKNYWPPKLNHVKIETLVTTFLALVLPQYPSNFPYLRSLDLSSTPFNNLSWVDELLAPIITGANYSSSSADELDVQRGVDNVRNFMNCRSFCFKCEKYSITEIGHVNFVLHMTSLTSLNLVVNTFCFPLIFELVNGLPKLEKLRLTVYGDLNVAHDTNLKFMTRDPGFRRLKDFWLICHKERPSSVTAETMWHIHQEMKRQEKDLFLLSFRGESNDYDAFQT